MLLAGFCCASGLMLLYASWRGLLPQRVLIKALGWALIAVSGLLWSLSSGVEFGSTFLLLAVPLFAWPLVLWQSERRRSSTDELHRSSIVWPTWSGFSRQLLLFTLAIPVAGLVSALICLSLMQFLPWQPVDQMAFGVLLMPLIWGFLMAWCVADSKPLRPTVSILIAGLLTGIHSMV